MMNSMPHWANHTDDKPAGLEQRYLRECGAQGDGELREGQVLHSLRSESWPPCLGGAPGGADKREKAKV